MLLQNLVPVDSDKIVRATYAEGKKICRVYVVVRRVSLPTYEYSDLQNAIFSFPAATGRCPKNKTRFIVGMVGQRVLEKILGGRLVCVYFSVEGSTTTYHHHNHIIVTEGTQRKRKKKVTEETTRAIPRAYSKGPCT